jgi:hypothetical protein
VCQDVPVVLSIVLALVRRIRPVTVAFAVYEAWKRLPPEQQAKILMSVRRNGPRVASTIARRGRPRP